MGEYDYATVPIEKDDSLSPLSARCHKDFEGEQPVISLGIGRIVASAILALTTSTIVLGGTSIQDLAGGTNSVIIQQLEIETQRTISLSEARRMAQELQNRIDADYQTELEKDAQVPAIWEETE